MAKIEFPGLEEYKEQLLKLGQEAPKIINRSLYEGAQVLAKEVQKEISGLKELNKKQRAGLHQGMGIAHFWYENGDPTTKIGFEGYNGIKTKRWPNGQPNAMIARSIQRGTSRLTPNRFCKRAAQNARERSIEAIKKHLDQELAEMFEKK